MKKLHAWLAVLLMIVGLGLVAPSSATASSYCGISWGSLAKSSSRMSTAPITNVRAGRHACFDRMVVDIKGKRTGFDVRYVKNVRSEGSGFVVPLKGAADLRVIVRSPAYNSKGQPTYTPRDRKNLADVSDFRTFRQIAWAGSFEGQTTIGLGVRARLPFRAFTIAGPGSNSRLVIDVAHRW
ncbi:hypothetical protein D477_008673 [Arthrobacter crystallopoietes BAB-32]|uniref:AMIN-like domain-containing protein n=1 Tax=Arthrobacter crystallopoietes BAB-32 TaxID=1246476 RepID=N1V3H8_9MICC|nr:hypothetical protein [Arthrobacter crystallopoietes]EMY34632.1 hypothetical protein D477_008673 [Arthrobacter crystallopoietes BAB-32]